MTKEEAVKAFGSVRKLADALGISEQAVHQWGDLVPELRKFQIREMLERQA